MNYRFDFDYEQEQFYNPEPIDNSRYDQARDEFERGQQRVNIVSGGRVLTSEEFEQLKER